MIMLFTFPCIWRTFVESNKKLYEYAREMKQPHLAEA